MKTFSLQDNKKFPIDWKLNEIFQKENGFYIELGANDGIIQSNTAFLNFYKNWKGILIEPNFVKYEECLRNRPSNIILNYACVSKDYNEEYIFGDFDNPTNDSLMSSIDGVRLGNKNLVKVKAITLEKILDENLKDKSIDFLSLDTEGYELNILKGLNLSKYRPKYILVEVYDWDYENIIKYLEDNNYKLHSNISNYNKIDNPIWDGTHNDYLFYDINNF
jgi:FkbM family methyltransferase